MTKKRPKKILNTYSMKLISNCSPIIFLAKLNFLELLENDQVLIPDEVRKELLKKESVEKDRIEKFLNQKNVSTAKPSKIQNFSNNLGKGELAVISLALEKKVPHILMDDRRGRALARLHNLKTHGTLWIILRAYKNGLINKTQAQDLIYELPSVGFRIDQEFLFQVLKRLK